MKSQLQEEMKLKTDVSSEPDNSKIGWEYTDGFLPKTEEPDSSSTQEPS